MTVLRLHMTETAEGDMWRLMGRQDADGPSHALEPDLERLAEGLSRIACAWREGRTPDLRADAAGVAHLTSRMGLNRIARVARAVELLAHETRETELAANVARLDRLGQGTLYEIWRLQDMPG